MTIPDDFRTFQLKFEVLRDGVPLPGWKGLTPGIWVSEDFLRDADAPMVFVNNSLLNDLRAILERLEAQIETDTQD